MKRDYALPPPSHDPSFRYQCIHNFETEICHEFMQNPWQNNNKIQFSTFLNEVWSKTMIHQVITAGFTTT